MPTLWGKTYTRSDLLRHIGDMRQLASVQPFELSDGRERGEKRQSGQPFLASSA